MHRQRDVTNPGYLIPPDRLAVEPFFRGPIGLGRTAGKLRGRGRNAELGRKEDLKSSCRREWRENGGAGRGWGRLISQKNPIWPQQSEALKESFFSAR